MNLLNETLEKLKDYGKTPKDILWVGSPEFGWFSWDEFTQIADLEYDDGFGASEVAEDLVVVGNDWWLERGIIYLTPENNRKRLTYARLIAS
jgi:hypothetical protein